MRNIVMASTFGLFVTLAGQAAVAGPIERACLSSDRPAASRGLCACIQAVANSALTSSDQRLASSFFKDPHRAQEVRQSDRSNHEAFWQRYKVFGRTAQTYCSPRLRG